MKNDRVEIALNAGTLWRAVITLLRLFLGAWMLNSGYSYWAQEFGWPPAFPQPFGTLPASNLVMNGETVPGGMKARDLVT